MMRVFVGTLVHAVSPTELELVVRGALRVDEHGVIVEVLRPPLPAWDATVHVVDLGKRFLVPGCW